MKPPGAFAVVRVEDRAGRFTDYAISKEAASRGLSIGSDPACDVRLSGPNVRPVHARLQPLSNHWVLKDLAVGQRLPLPENIEGDFDRVDRVPFEIEGLRLQVYDG